MRHPPALQHEGCTVGGREAENNIGFVESAQGQPEVEEEEQERRERHDRPQPEPRQQAGEEHLLVARLAKPEPVRVVAGDRRPHQADRHHQSDDCELNPALTSHGLRLLLQGDEP
jgi:hypothetical protein